MPPVSPDGIRSVRRTVAARERHRRHALDRADPADHRDGLVRQRGVLAEERLAGRDGQQVRADPVQLGEQRRAARLGDPEDGDHRGDPDRDPERGQPRTEPARLRGHGRRCGPDRARPTRPPATGAERGAAVAVMPRPPALDAAVADLDAARQRGRDVAVVGDDDDRRAVLGLQLAEQLQDRRRRSPCRGCRSARRRARAPGRPTRARAIATRWRSPPDKAPGRCVSRCPSPTRSSATPAAALRRPAGMPR